MKKRLICCIFTGFFLILLLGGCKLRFLSDLYPVRETISIGGQESRTETGEQKQPVSGQNPEENTGSGDSWVYVHVCGCVKNPGLYRLARGQRIDAAIRRAGGFTREADTKSVNLASLLEDGSQIEVLSIDSGGSDDSSRKDNRVNINLAGKEDLMTLHGIGESRALAIIAYREEHGGFSSVEELKEVDGIGDGIYQKIKNTIRI